jgi:hypothetical protein
MATDNQNPGHPMKQMSLALLTIMRAQSPMKMGATYDLVAMSQNI